MNFDNYEDFENYQRHELRTLKRVDYSQAYSAIKRAWCGGDDVVFIGFSASIRTRIDRRGDAIDKFEDVSTINTSLKSIQGADQGSRFMKSVYEPLANGGYDVHGVDFFASEDLKIIRLPQYMGQQVGIDIIKDGGEW